jgi:hypothetical protein
MLHPLARLIPLSALCLGLGLGFAWFSPRPAAVEADALPPFDPSAPGQIRTASVTDPFGAGTSSSPFSSSAAGPLGARELDRAEPAVSASASAGSTPLTPEKRARLISEIEAAYTTYHPDSLPVLSRFLAHPDLEIRTFARDAIVQVGHEDGAAVLRAAAREAQDPRESVALLDAAEFLELPPAPPVAGVFKPRANPKRRDVSLRRSDSVADAAP